MLSLVSPDLEAYARAHTTERHPAYAALQAVTEAETELPQMLVGAIEGTLLTLLARLTGARRAVDVGTFTGYSSMSIAEGLQDGGRVVTCDIDPTYNHIAREHWGMVPWGDRVELRLGPAIETLKGLDGPLDLAFIDADKVSYVDYWEAIIPMLRPGGVVVVDNVLWSGKVLAPDEPSDHAIVAFNTHAHNDDRVEKVLLSVRDGMLLGVKR